MHNKNFIRAIAFILLTILSDILIGEILERVHKNTDEETSSKMNYIFNSSNEDIIVIGSSRAENHFISEIIKESTGLSCYNAGIGGQGLFFSYIEINEIVKRYKPKHIILEVSPNVLIDKKSDEKLKILLPYYKKDTLIYNKLFKPNSLEKIKLISSIYPYNSMIVGFIHAFIKKKIFNKSGFVGLKGNINPKTIRTYPDSKISIDWKNLTNISEKCKNNNIDLVVVISPIFKTDPLTEHIIKEIDLFCQKANNLRLIDYSNNAKFVNNNELFYDNLHLNEHGAKLFTKDLINHFFNKK